MKTLLSILTLFVLLAAGAQAAVAGRADRCIPVGKLPPGVKLPGKNNPPGYIRLPPGITYPGAVQCPSGGTPTKPKPSAKAASFSGRVALPAGSTRAGVLAIHLPGGEIAAAQGPTATPGAPSRPRAARCTSTSAATSATAR
ncbi:MAG TPA: hypothetical protein VGF23_20495 [Gaiellaceae bacterium]|jgi:hypothetical protein